MPVNGAASFTTDFDLRKSVVDPAGAYSDYHLKPALRLVVNVQVGGGAPFAGDCATPQWRPCQFGVRKPPSR